MTAEKYSYNDLRSGSIFSSFCQASGIIIISASGRLLPARTKSSRTQSKAPKRKGRFGKRMRSGSISHPYTTLAFLAHMGFIRICVCKYKHQPESYELSSIMGRISFISSFDKPSFLHFRRPSRDLILEFHNVHHSYIVKGSQWIIKSWTKKLRRNISKVRCP